MKNELQVTNRDFIIYKDGNNNVKVSVMLINNDLWLTQNLIANLFDVSKNTISFHINNIFNSGELSEDGNISKIEVAQELAYKEYDKYRVIQDKMYVSDFDRFVQEALELEERVDV